MSSSALDYYRVSWLKESLKEYNEYLADAREEVVSAEETLERAKELVQEHERKTNSLEDGIAAAELHLKDACIPVTDTAGLPMGEKYSVPDDSIDYLQSIWHTRKLMKEKECDIDLVLEADAKTTEIAKSNDCCLHPRAVFMNKDTDTFEIPNAGFVSPRSIPCDEILKKTFDYAKNNREQKELFDWLLSLDHKKGKEINKVVFMDILKQIREIENFRREQRLNDQDIDDDEQSDNDNLITKFNKSAWDFIELAVKKNISDRSIRLKHQKSLLNQDSSLIANYNPFAHFSFESHQAIASVDILQHALCFCKLRPRPTSYFENEAKVERLPFEIRTYGVSGFDIDGDLMAMCGELNPQELRGSDNYVGFQMVPCPTNLTTAKIASDLEDATGSNEPWDTNTVKTISLKKEYFSFSIADATNRRIWASSSRGSVHAFSITDDITQEPMAKLAFANDEIEAQPRLRTYPIVCLGDFIMGSAGTGRLSIWDTKKGIDEYPMKPKKRAKLNNDGLAPKTVSIDDGDNFRCGDIQCLGGSQILIAPLRDFSSRSRSLRLFDIHTESVVGLFCGSQSDVSIGKQYCVNLHNTIFSMDNSTGLVWDMRTFQPSCILQTGNHTEILGVPTSSSASPVAFTYGEQSESIACWDLRMPGSHVYTMGTGNTDVTTLLWHEKTGSLLASTRSDHAVTHGKYGRGYMYGDDISSDEEDKMKYADWWPRNAKHEESYFGKRWHIDCQYSPVMIQYAFENGRKMHLPN